jgi:hypothetical protein
LFFSLFHLFKDRRATRTTKTRATTGARDFARRSPAPSGRWCQTLSATAACLPTDESPSRRASTAVLLSNVGDVMISSPHYAACSSRSANIVQSSLGSESTKLRIRPLRMALVLCISDVNDCVTVCVCFDFFFRNVWTLFLWLSSCACSPWMVLHWV